MLSRLHNHARFVKTAGWSYILLAVFYTQFEMAYMLPQVNDPSVLENFAFMGEGSKMALTLLSLTPFLLIFGSLGVYSLLRPKQPLMAGSFFLFSSFAAFAFFISLARLATVNWNLSEAATNASAENLEGLMHVFNYANAYLGQFVGQFIGQLLLVVTLLIFSFMSFQSKRFPMWLSLLASMSAVFLGLGVHKDAGSMAETCYMFAQILMPVFFLSLGIGLLVVKGKSQEKPLAHYEKKPKKKKSKAPKSKKRKPKRSQKS